MKKIFAALLTALPLLAVDGIVVNGTTGVPQAGVKINLVQPTQNGMVPLGDAVSGSQGEFRIDKAIPPGPGLLQATFEGNTYNQIIAPGMPTSGVRVAVYNSTRDAKIGTPSEHLILLERDDQQIKISETFIFQNQSSTTFADPVNGSVRFYLPPAAGGKAQAIISAPGGMPIPRSPIALGKQDLYKIDYPVKPGETRMEVSYSLPASDSFVGKIASSSASTHLVTPFSVTVEGPGVEPAGQEPQTQAHIYTLRGASFNLKITGSGSLRNEQPAETDEDSGQHQVEVAPARIYSKQNWILGIIFGILAIGGWMLFQKRVA